VTSSQQEPFNIETYWEERYADKGNSGSGSYGRLADYKASILNKFVAERAINDVIEFGCGDGNQLRSARYPAYLGFDISDTIISRCREEFRGHDNIKFYHIRHYDRQKADLSISLDVIFHLVNDADFREYLERLFSAAKRYVIIYSSNTDEIYNDSAHVRHREFTGEVEKFSDFFLSEFIECPLNRRRPENANLKRRETTWCDFYIFQRR